MSETVAYWGFCTIILPYYFIRLNFVIEMYHSRIREGLLINEEMGEYEPLLPGNAPYRLI